MKIIFGAVHGGDPKAYIQSKLAEGPRRAGVDLDQDHIATQAAIAADTQLGSDIPVTPAEEQVAFTPTQEAENAARKRCVQATLLRESPLVPGEELKDDFFSYLKAPFHMSPANTAVLVRRTNRAELIYVFDGWQLDTGQLTFNASLLEGLIPASEPADEPKPLGKNIVGSIFSNLASGLVSGIGGKIGALIFDQIFPPGVPDYFDEVYKGITTIVHQELTKETMSQINGRINGTVAWLRNTYKPLKEGGKASRRDLFEQVNSYSNLMYTEGVYTLMEPRYEKPGFTIFMISAGIHLTLLQEQALVDPNQTTPSESSFAKSVSLNAQTYAAHAKATFPDIVKARAEQVKVVEGQKSECNIGGCLQVPGFRYRDSITGAQGVLRDWLTKGKNGKETAKNEARRDGDRYWESYKPTYISHMNHPTDVAATWLKLVQQPVPAT